MDGLRDRIEAEIHHSEDNGFVITDGQGFAPGERVPAVPIRYIRAALAARPEPGELDARLTEAAQSACDHWFNHIDDERTFRLSMIELRAALADRPEPGELDAERLRIATWRLSNAADALVRHAQHPDDPGHRSWFRSAIGDVDREIGLARAAAGPSPSTAEYRRLREAR